ncbi:MAG TPA: S-layer homology domain-containing protein [Thermoanaerobaculia bacterium]|jgi:hypothetical protein
MSLRPGILVLSALLAGAPLGAQTDSSDAVEPRDYGAGNTNILQIPAAAFQPTLTGNFTYDSEFYFYPGSGGAVFAVAPVQLPSGSKITQIGIYYDDTDAVNEVSATLYATSGYNASASHAQVGTVSSSGNAGKNYAASTAFAYTVNNNVRYGGGAQLLLILYAGSASTKFKAVDVVWTRQLSPGPATPTFGDVPKSSPFYNAIEALAKAGITGGCGNGNFCPTGNVTRQEVAKFLSRALGLYWPDQIP